MYKTQPMTVAMWQEQLIKALEMDSFFYKFSAASAVRTCEPNGQKLLWPEDCRVIQVHDSYVIDQSK